MKFSELTALWLKAIVATETHKHKMSKDINAILYRKTSFGKLQILFSELSNRASDS